MILCHGKTLIRIFPEKLELLNHLEIILNKISSLTFPMFPFIFFYFPLFSRAQQETFLALGSDWFLLFTQSYLHSSTVVLGMKLLLCFLHNRSLLNKFKEGIVAGRWLENSSTGLNILMGMCWFNAPETIP